MNGLSEAPLYCCIYSFVLVCATVQAAPPKDVMLVLDDSGSMRKNDPQFLAQEAVAEFINNFDENVRVGVLIFDQSVRQVVPLTLADETGKAIVVESIQNMNYTGQLTDSPAAVERAIYELKTNRREGAAQYIVFMTDGAVDTGKVEADVEKTKWLREDLAVDAADNNIKVFAIAFTEYADFFAMQTLAKKTGGEYFRSLMPGDLGKVLVAVNEMLNVTSASIATTVPSVVVTPLPDEKLVAEPLADATSSEDPFLALTPDDLLVLAQISAQTGIPIEELAQELVGANIQATGPDVESGSPISALSEAFDEQDSIGIASVASVAVVLLLLVVLVVWFVMHRRSVLPAVVSSTRVSKQTAIPEAFTFFEDILVEPTPDDENSSMSEVDNMFDIGGGVVPSTGESKLDVPTSLMLEEFAETDSLDTPATIPPSDPKSVSEEEGDVTLEPFISASAFEDGEATLTNEEEVMSPDQVQGDVEPNLTYKKTVKLSKRKQFNNQNDGKSEDPTVLG